MCDGERKNERKSKEESGLKGRGKYVKPYKERKKNSNDASSTREQKSKKHRICEHY